MIRLSLLAAACTLCTSVAFAGTTFYDFSGVAGDSTPASVGIATFSSPDDSASTTATGSGEFSFGPNAGLYSALGGTVLGETGPFSGSALDISFSAPQDSVTFDFAVGDFLASNGSDTVTITASNGATTTASAAIPGGSGDFFPQGALTLTSSAGFASVVISASDAAGPETLTIADLSSVPEPASMTLLGAGIAGLVGLRRRR